jgi:aryl-alcohol dehydrogenase-like predicted oxidoreductase
MGATKPSQVKENVKAAGVKLSPDQMKAIDKALGSIPNMDPTENKSPKTRS